MPDATFDCPDLTTFCRLDELGLVETGQRLEPDRAVLACRVVEPDIAETQELIDYCAARKITADIELIRPDQINTAFDRIVNKDVRYRFVIDFTAGRQG